MSYKQEPKVRSRWDLALALLALLSAALGPGVAQARPEPTRVRLQLKWFHAFQFAGYYAAQSRGYYRDAGLEVEIVEGAPDRLPIRQVADQQIEFGVHDGGDLLYAHLTGEPVVALAAVFQHSPYVILSLRDTGIRTPSDLAGRTMMDESHGASPLLAMLKREGVAVGDQASPSAVQLLPHSWQLEDLVERRVDAMTAYLTDEPLKLKRRGIEVATLNPVDYGVDFYGDTLFTSEALLTHQPDLVEAFRAASMRGWDYAMSRTEELAAQIQSMPTQRSVPLTRQALLDEADAMQRIVLSSLVEIGHMNPGRWQRMAREFAFVGVTPDISRVEGFVPDPQAAERRRQRLLELLGYGLGAVLLIALGSLLWVRQLRRRVRQRTVALEEAMALREEQARQLAAAEQKTRAILAALPDQVVTMRRDGELVDILAPGSDEALGQLAANVHGSERADLPGGLRDKLRCAFDSDGGKQTMDVREVQIEIGGETRVLETRSVPLDADQVVCVVRNVTEQRRAQERLALLAAAVEQAAEDIVITDADIVIQYVNPAFEASTGYRSDEVVGKRPSILKSGQHDDAFYAELHEILARGEIWQGRFQNRTKDGCIILQDASIVAIRDAEGHTQGYVSARRDVTQQVELENQVEQSQRMQAIGTLAGGIAHDFNNVLAGVVGFAELALDREGNPAGTVEDLQRVQKAAQRAAALTRQILDFSRRLPDEARPVRVHGLVEEALKMVRATIPSSVEVQLRSSSQTHARLAPGDVERIVVNLCTNASLAIGVSPGQILVELEEVDPTEVAEGPAEIRDAGIHLRLSVTDNGCGMTPVVRKRLFEPFFTTRTGGEGTGLGLSVVHGIVKSRGGVIQVFSEPNRGSRFDVWIPISEPEPSAQAAEPPTALTGSGRILLVDDEDMITTVFKQALEKRGYTVEIHNSSPEALRAFETAPGSFDLVVTDLSMPKLRGDDLAAKVKAIRPEVCVLLCTGNDLALDPSAVGPMGVDRVLQKPLSISQMAAAIQSILEPSR